MLEGHKELHDSIAIALIKIIEEEALYHYAGCETAEEFFTEIGQAKAGSERYDLLNLARITSWCKAHDIVLYEPSDNTGQSWREVANQDDWFVAENRDGSSRRGRLRDAVPLLRQVIGLNDKESLCHCCGKKPKSKHQPAHKSEKPKSKPGQRPSKKSTSNKS